MVRCPKCGYEIKEENKGKLREEAESIFNLAISGKKREIEEKYMDDKTNISDVYSILKKFSARKK